MLLSKRTVQWTKNETYWTCLFKVGFTSKERFMLWWCLVCLVSFQWQCELRHKSGQCHNYTWWFGDRCFPFNCCWKIKIIHSIFQKKHRLELLKHFRHHVRNLEKRTVLYQSLTVLSDTYFASFSHH